MRRTVALGVLFTLCIFGLIFRMWYLQHVHGEDYNRFAARQRALKDIERVFEVFSPMPGGFVDRHMQPITGTQQVFTVYLDAYALNQRYQAGRRAFADNDIREEVFNAISMSLDLPIWKLYEMMRTDDEGNLIMTSGQRRRVLRHDVSVDIAIPLTDMFTEVRREETSLRWYQDPFFAPQVIGFMRGDSVWGLEAQYRTELEGEQGRNVFVQGETETVPVRDGHTIVTTLDGEIQRLAQYYVDRTFLQHPSQFVGMIVMNPFTGEILAMAQAPTFSLADPFNPEYFTDPHLAEIWEQLDSEQRTNEVMSLWRNFHTTRSSEPGSTFKPFVIAAAIEEGAITRHNIFYCEGRRDILGQTIGCWNEHGCGTLSLRRALYRSCNLAMVDINRMLTRKLFYRYRGYFGFGERTGIDLPGEECVSSPLVMYPFAMLNPVEMATSSMGQGFNATTIQMINGYAALINGGTLMRPFLVSQIVDNQGNIVQQTEPTEVRRVISTETSDFIRTEMRYVVSMRPGVGELTGTGWRSYIPGFSIGGKTGTAQQGVRADRINSLTYISFMPVNNPQFLVLMTIDQIEDYNLLASDTVVPIVREFYMDLIRLRNIQPTDDAGDIASDVMATPMPDFSGQNLIKAVHTAINMGTGSYHVVGSGTIISHTWPAPGQPMPETATITFFMDSETRTEGRMTIVPDVESLTAQTASFLLLEAGLPAVLITNRSATGDNDFRPHTINSETMEEGENAATLSYVVYRQFPAAGAEIEQGTQVIIRAR